MRVLVIGATGLLGYDVVRSLKNQRIEFCGVGSDELDITNFEYTNSYIRNYLPDVIVHCAAYTNVDKAESEVEKCRVINVDATANIASLCKEINAKLVYVSTDYVFSGEEPALYEIDSEVSPLSVYGQSKLDGERAVLQKVEKYFIIRTSWAYGVNGDNFVKTMLKIGKKKIPISVVSDQVGSPTFTQDLAALIIQIIQSDKYGIYHATNEGYCSWAEFAVEIFRQVGGENKVEFIKSEQYLTKAIRPKNSNLSKASLDVAGFNRLPHWKDALTRYLIEVGAILK